MIKTNIPGYNITWAPQKVFGP